MGITRQQALDCFHSDDLIGIGMEADAVRRALHPEGVVTYVVDRTLCVTAPAFNSGVEEAVDVGATGLTLRGSLHNLADGEALLASLRLRYPALWLHGLSASVVVSLAADFGLQVIEVLRRLQAAGLDSLSGDDAGCLGVEDRSRCSAADWLATHRAAHSLKLPTTVTLLFGNGESFADRLEHLEAIHDLQQQTGGFLSFKPVAAPLPNFQEPTAVEYLKTLAIARMVLDTVPHIEADWPAQGLKVLQMALRFGANDVGTVFPGESLRNPDGTTEEDLRRVIRGAGLRPVQRDTAFRACFLS